METKNQGGGLTDGPFNLLVACGPLNTRFAVVGYSANLVRSTSGTSLTALGAGRYQVRVHVGRGAAAPTWPPWPIRPADSSSTRRACTPGRAPTRKTVYIETKNPGGGLQDGVPFHLSRHLLRHGHTRGSPW